jgi:hypothetical protein
MSLSPEYEPEHHSKPGYVRGCTLADGDGPEGVGTRLAVMEGSDRGESWTRRLCAGADAFILDRLPRVVKRPLRSCHRRTEGRTTIGRGTPCPVRAMSPRETRVLKMVRNLLFLVNLQNPN